MKIIYINGSPRLKKSNSNSFILRLDEKANIKYIYKDKFKYIFNEMLSSDTIIFSFPLYVDSPPSKVIEFIEYIELNNLDLKGENVYVICNCGFLEAKQNFTATKIIESFCINNKMNYKGSLCIGAGEIIGKIEINKLYKLASIGYIIKSKKFKKSIMNNKITNLKTTIHPMTKRLYLILANINWNKSMKKNDIY